MLCMWYQIDLPYDDLNCFVVRGVIKPALKYVVCPVCGAWGCEADMLSSYSEAAALARGRPWVRRVLAVWRCEQRARRAGRSGTDDEG